MNESHKRAIRRDRRKAKATDWRRQGKTSMGSRVGHGTVGAGHKYFVAVSLPSTSSRDTVPRSELVRLAKEIGSGGLSSLKDTLARGDAQRVKK
jgi:hypothetical protein